MDRAAQSAITRSTSVHPAALGALLAFFGVALGAFGTHILEDNLSPERLGTFDTAVRYQMYHALALIALGALPGQVWRAAWFLFGGALVFSGSLYLLIASGVGILGAITPIGGALMLLGWALLVFDLVRLSRG